MFQLLTIGWYKEKSWRPYLIVREWESKTIRKIEILGREINVRFKKERHCIGYRDLKGEDRYFFFSCLKNFPIVKASQCEFCEEKDIVRRMEINPESLPEEIRKEMHCLYLAYFSKELIKCGVALERNLENRLIEQGALAAVVLEKMKDGIEIRRREKEVASENKFKLSISAEEKEKIFSKGINLEEEEKKFKEVLKKLGIEEEIISLKNAYNFRSFDKCVKAQNIQGKIKFCIGEFLFFEKNAKLFFFNVSENRGKLFEFGKEKNTIFDFI